MILAEKNEAWIGCQGKRFFLESEISCVHRVDYRGWFVRA
jgi:hypothetical protein